MEMDLSAELPAILELPADYTWLPWDDALLEAHGDVKHQCFHHELDGIIFPSLSNRAGCTRLMREIRSRAGFCPEATWLLAYGTLHVGTVQGIADRAGCGGIQNLGVIPEHRKKGLGAALLLQALHGFRRAGLTKATLEVTAQNEFAIRVYRRIGFRFRKTIYKTVESQTYTLEPVTAMEWVV
jgi:ribosomal protein S18 acetylase RimI-like enzyme